MPSPSAFRPGRVSDCGSRRGPDDKIPLTEMAAVLMFKAGSG